MKLRPAHILLLLILAAAAFLRFWQLDDMPPGWRDDELINSLVISQHVIDGDWRLYYPDASGHEGLYHILNALPLYLFGPTAAGIRWLSAVMGTALVLFTYWLTRELFGREDIALAAAAGLAFSFWGLMYSRIGLRHISLIFLVTPAFAFLWQGINRAVAAKNWEKDGRLRRKIYVNSFLPAGLLLGLAFYTYFASRGVPLIILAWLGFLLVFNRSSLSRVWTGTWVTLFTAALLAVPLILTLRAQPEAEARVAELAVPIVEARQGNFEPLLTFTWRTLNMFHSDGDDEFLYNIPGRPLFNPLGALFFWTGVALAAIAAGYGGREMGGRQRRGRSFFPQIPHSAARFQAAPAAFLLLWLFAGIAPAFISVPPASLSHTILAQPATYIAAALPVGWGAAWLAGRFPTLRPGWLPPALALILLLAIAPRDLTDYFVTWPERGNTRFLYRADIHDVARTLQAANGPQDVGLTGLLAGPWDRVAFEANLGEAAGRVDGRWFDPRRALLLVPERSWIGYPRTVEPFAPGVYNPTGRTAGGYSEALVDPAAVPNFPPPTCFANGLCAAAQATTTAEGIIVDLLITVDRPLDLPDQPLISNPPPPGVYAGPRLMAFAQLLDRDGRFLAGDDALGVDPQTLEVGDVFWQRHRLTPPPGQIPATIKFGFYDPKTAARIPTVDGQDAVRVEIGY